MRTVEYLGPDGKSPFALWFAALPPQAAAKVATALSRIELGNLSNAKAIGEGVSEFRIDWGPGYRIYFGRDGEELVILLAGGSKHRQQRDIKLAKSWWRDYKLRKKGG